MADRNLPENKNRNNDSTDGNVSDSQSNDSKIKRLEKELEEKTAEIEELKTKYTDVKTTLKKNEKVRKYELDRFTRMNKGIAEYTKTTQSTEQTLKKENKELNAKIEVLSQQLSDIKKQNDIQKNKIDDSLETIRRHETTIKQLSSDKTVLTRELSLKERQMDFLLKDYSCVQSKVDNLFMINKEQLEQIAKLTKNNERLMTRNGKLVETNKKIGNVVEKCRLLEEEVNRSAQQMCGSDCYKTKEKNKKLINDINNIKKQRHYFEEQNDAKKQKLLAVSHTDVKAREVYANAVREQGFKDMSTSVKVFEEMITKVTNVLTEEKLKLKEMVIENLAVNIENISEKIIKIQESQKKMETKGPDGKLLCGDCDKMYGSVSALKQHMTVTHGINTTDIWKNQLNIDEDLIIID